ncbi:MAG: zinc-dependent alcohol dehydrogenase family protein [Gammaproteobacteria bacterium]|nr:zinc-dependent alcohol dehydrogenase family protein [Gammaproteobacteria bacterium]
MQAIQLISHGTPATSCECIEVPVSAPAAGEVQVAIKAAAINPADLLIFEGRYPGPATLPALVGIEGAGIVTAVGTGVDDLAVGDHVISMGRANWADSVTADAEQFLPIPKELPWEQAAQLNANPPSAHLMLRDYVDLKEGDWVIQNAANSAVGRHVIAFCKARGLRSINIVRREVLVDELISLGADQVLVDHPDVATRVRERVGPDANIPLGIDALGGDGTLKLANTLSNGGTVVNYGFLSGQPCQMTPTNTIVESKTLKGFWLVGFMQSASRAEKVALYAEMSNAFISGQLQVPVEASYPLQSIGDALGHAHRESRKGKILLVPDANQ